MEENRAQYGTGAFETFLRGYQVAGDTMREQEDLKYKQLLNQKTSEDLVRMNSKVDPVDVQTVTDPDAKDSDVMKSFGNLLNTHKELAAPLMQIRNNAISHRVTQDRIDAAERTREIDAEAANPLLQQIGSNVRFPAGAKVPNSTFNSVFASENRVLHPTPQKTAAGDRIWSKPEILRYISNSGMDPNKFDIPEEGLPQGEVQKMVTNNRVVTGPGGKPADPMLHAGREVGVVDRVRDNISRSAWGMGAEDFKYKLDNSKSGLKEGDRVEATKRLEEATNWVVRAVSSGSMTLQEAQSQASKFLRKDKGKWADVALPALPAVAAPAVVPTQSSLPSGQDLSTQAATDRVASKSPQMNEKFLRDYMDAHPEITSRKQLAQALGITQGQALYELNQLLDKVDQ